MPGSEVPGSEPAHLRRRRKRSRATGEARGLASKQIPSWFCMVLANLLLFSNFGTIKYLLYCGSRRNRLAGTEPIPVRFRNTGWRTLRSSFALGSIENVVIVTESCEMTVFLYIWDRSGTPIRDIGVRVPGRGERVSPVAWRCRSPEVPT